MCLIGLKKQQWPEAELGFSLDLFFLEGTDLATILGNNPVVTQNQVFGLPVGAGPDPSAGGSHGAKGSTASSCAGTR